MRKNIRKAIRQTIRCRFPSLKRGMGAVLVLLVLLTSCNGDVITSNKYCNLYANFSYNPVSAISQLYSACNAQGTWCTIRAVNEQYVFAIPGGGQTPINKLALNNYSRFYMGLSGFIVGLPQIAELGANDQLQVTCYDLACSNCYRNGSVAKMLTLNNNGTAYCKNCKRTYDLNYSSGQVSQGEAGIGLYRYRVYYGNNTLSINNK